MGASQTGDKSTSYFPRYFPSEMAKKKHVVTKSKHLYKAKQEKSRGKLKKEVEQSTISNEANISLTIILRWLQKNYQNVYPKISHWAL